MKAIVKNYIGNTLVSAHFMNELKVSGVEQYAECLSNYFLQIAIMGPRAAVVDSGKSERLLPHYYVGSNYSILLLCEDGI